MSKPVALITGSSRGIGRSIAEQLSRDGHRVVINYASRADAAEEVVAGIRAAGGEAIAVGASVAVAEDRQKLIRETLEQFGRLDVLVNNAGITSPGRLDLLEATEESWDQVFATNLKGAFFLAQLAAREMIAQRERGALERGTIINISSISAFTVSTDRADYCIAKAGMGMLTELLAARLAEAAIAVFEICPGVIASDMTAPVKEKYDRLIEEGLTPIRRWGQPQDIATTVSTLAAGGLPFATGQRLHIDGGFHIRRL